MERYKGYRVPINSVKAGSLLQKLADREQTTSDDILHHATKPDPQEPKAVGPHTSTEELLEVLDLVLGSEGSDIEHDQHGESEAVSTQGETECDGEAPVIVPTRKKRKSKKEAASSEDDPDHREPKFVELTKLLPPLPKKGTFEVNSVKKSLYFFS